MARDNKKYAHCSEKHIQYVINDNGCHICTSHKFDNKGYPRIRRNGKSMLMSRFIFEQQKGIIPDGLIIRHKCDNPNCINIEHLELGTSHDNMQDMADRGRMYKPCVKLNKEQVKMIRTRLECGHSSKRIARDFCVSEPTISFIRHKKTWKNVE